MKTPKVTYGWFVMRNGQPLPHLYSKHKVGELSWGNHYPVFRFALIPAAVAKTPAVQSALRVHAAKKKESKK